MNPSKASRIREYLTANPGKTTREIAEALGLPFEKISPALGMMKTSMHVRSEIGGKTLANREFMKWYVTGQKLKKSRRQKKPATLKPQAPQKSSGIVPQLNLDDLIESMASSLVFSIVNKVKEKLPKALAAISMPEMVEKSSQPQKLLPAPEVEETRVIPTTLPKVGVVGLLPVQAGAISAKFANTFDLRFWNDGEDKGTLKGMAENCEVVFLHTRHAGHHTDQLLKAYGGNIRRVTGGVANMKTSIYGYYSEKVAA